MYICLCKAVTDHQIQDAVMAGANSFRQVQAQLAVSTGCGRCASAAQLVIERALNDKATRPGASGSSLNIADLTSEEVSSLVYAA